MSNIQNNLKIYIIPLFVVLCISCVATTVKKEEHPINNRIMAENSSIKKRLPLIERENDVLKKENLQHRTKILDMEAKTKKLELELAFLNEKYDNDTVKNGEQIRGLQLMIEETKNESTKKINSLISLKAAAKKKSAQTIKNLKRKNILQKESFNKELEQIKQANAKQMLGLSNQIDSLKKALKTKNLESASLKKAKNEMSAKLIKTTALVKTLQISRDESVAELESVKATNKKLTKALNSIQ